MTKPPTSPLPRVVFAMDQIAGHITNYRNIRHAIESEPTPRIDPRWVEVEYHREGGRLERAAGALHVVPNYVSGVTRGMVDMRRGLAEHDAEVIFTNASVALFFTRRFRRTPTLYDFDSTPLQLDRMESYTPNPDPAPLAKLKWKLQQRLFRDATVLQAWSNWAKQSVIDDYGIDGEKILVNPPGIDLTEWQPVDRPFHRDQRRPARVLMVGGDFDRKGGHDLLSWFSTHRDDHIEIDIVTREDVESREGVRVHQGMTPNSPELHELYRTADLFVLPSHGECFGISTIEAMATGLPVIQSTVGGAHDIVEEGENGFLVPPHDPAALGAAIDAVLADPASWQAMGNRSRELATERFDIHVNTRITVDRLAALASVDAPPR